MPAHAGAANKSTAATEDSFAGTRVLLLGLDVTADFVFHVALFSARNTATAAALNENLNGT